jgi:uncharacterized protein YydD (DUF2326 family)
MTLSSLLPSFLRSAAKEIPTTVKSPKPLYQTLKETRAAVAQIQKAGDTVILNQTKDGKDSTTRATRRKTNKEARKLYAELAPFAPSNANEYLKSVKASAKTVTETAQNFFSKALKSINNALSTLTKPFRYIYQQLKKLFNRGASNEAAKEAAAPAKPKQQSTSGTSSAAQ